MSPPRRGNLQSTHQADRQLVDDYNHKITEWAAEKKGLLDQIKLLNEQVAAKNTEIEELRNAKDEEIKRLNTRVTDINAAIEELKKARDDEIKQLNTQATANATAMEQLNTQAKEKDTAMEQLNTQAKEKDTEIRRLKEQATANATAMEQFNTQAKEKDTEIQRLTEQATANATAMEQLNTQAKEKDTEIQRLKEQAKEKDTAITQLEKAKNEEIEKLRAQLAEKADQPDSVGGDGLPNPVGGDGQANQPDSVGGDGLPNPVGGDDQADQPDSDIETIRTLREKLESVIANGVKHDLFDANGNVIGIPRSSNDADGKSVWTVKDLMGACKKAFESVYKGAVEVPWRDDEPDKLVKCLTRLFRQSCEYSTAVQKIRTIAGVGDARPPLLNYLEELLNLVGNNPHVRTENRLQYLVVCASAGREAIRKLPIFVRVEAPLSETDRNERDLESACIMDVCEEYGVSVFQAVLAEQRKELDAEKAKLVAKKVELDAEKVELDTEKDDLDRRLNVFAKELAKKSQGFAGDIQKIVNAVRGQGEKRGNPAENTADTAASDKQQAKRSKK